MVLSWVFEILFCTQYIIWRYILKSQKDWQVDSAALHVVNSRSSDLSLCKRLQSHGSITKGLGKTGENTLSFCRSGFAGFMAQNLETNISLTHNSSLENILSTEAFGCMGRRAVTALVWISLVHALFTSSGQKKGLQTEAFSEIFGVICPTIIPSQTVSELCRRKWDSKMVIQCDLFTGLDQHS